MPAINAKIIVPDKLMPDFISGKITVKGLAKSSKTNQIVKHLELLSADKDSLMSLKSAGICLLVVEAVVGLAFAGVKLFEFFSERPVKNFKKTLNKYIEAINEQRLTEDIIKEMIVATDKLKNRCNKKIILKLSTEEFTDLIQCLCDYTKDLAHANSVTLSDSVLNNLNDNLLMKFKRNLCMQKSILEQAA